MKFSRRETSVILISLSCLALLINGPIAGAELALGRPFSDHMVVQRNVELPIWGKAASGMPVEVRIGTETRMTVAGEDGSWRVTFPAREASIRSVVIEIESADELLTVRDVLFGEVWLCAGQSNMEWPVSATASANEALTSADKPHIRLLNYQGAARGGSGRYSAEHLGKLTAERFCKGSWHLCSAETVSTFSAVGYYFGLALQRELGVPIGLINVSIGGTPAEAWVRREALAAHSQLKTLVHGNWLENGHLGPWCRERAAFNLGRAAIDGETIPGDELGPNHSFKPSFMWESAIATLIPFPIRGVIWYQGESNSQLDWRVRQHRAIFELLVADWRKQFGLGEFPFLFVQLPGMGRPHWPEFREQQRRILKRLPNTGMAITIDIGHPTNVHPTTKKPVGERLARWALAKTYGRKTVVASGPLYRSMRIAGRHIELEFDHAGSGLQTRDGLPLRHFEIAGADGKFHPAQANIVSGRVVVSCDAVEQPKHVRYGWIMFPSPSVNFFNRENLPASPFTTLIDE